MAKCNIPQAQLDAYAAHIRADYVKWWGAKVGEKHVQEMIEEFQISFEAGPSYIKVIKEGSNRSVHSFIVNKESNKYLVGTILKSASWKAPATNFGRGHIAYPDSWVGRVSWTGAN
jgi:hypothetical protein